MVSHPVDVTTVSENPAFDELGWQPEVTDLLLEGRGLGDPDELELR